MKKLTTEDFITRAKKIHGKTYCYESTVYSGMLEKVEICCPVHGIFTKRASEHIREQQGCPQCSHNYPLTSEDFVERSQKKYGTQYSLVSDFNGMKHSIKLSCREHGECTLNKAEGHFQKNGGCPTCAHLKRLEGFKIGNTSKAETKWLDSLSVPLRQYRIEVDGEYFLVDGFDPTTNTVYEYYGSFWHGNPKIYNPNQINGMKSMTFGKLYENTITRENKIKTKYNVVCKWGI